jgi:hypothetical protein
MASQEDRDPIVTRLNVLINLSLEGSGDSMAARILRLTEMGLSSAEVADIVGKPTRYVAATLAQRKEKKKGKVSD